jgi:hypothetical protein
MYDIRIGYFEDGYVSTGNYIHILYNGEFRVGEVYFKEGKRWMRGTWYKTDGTAEEYDS